MYSSAMENSEIVASRQQAMKNMRRVYFLGCKSLIFLEIATYLFTALIQLI